jgi:hypothetical protein
VTALVFIPQNRPPRKRSCRAFLALRREYETELRRRARALPDVQDAFGQNVPAFDRAWCGLHVVTRDALREFQSNLARIRAC